ncbi:hypothetical protein CYMTET_3142 [Cymbomonas tetramitiformis]|uniref:SET domain-containing protein n=1 Tax=Cymbomonas tetramitiformis TaxID=36881 RepID=A0AAE0H3Y0_9CHLO|nr:hypothetical protein CYMTET_3142 [Cymbomonas tetramitiformis]
MPGRQLAICSAPSPNDITLRDVVPDVGFRCWGFTERVHSSVGRKLCPGDVLLMSNSGAFRYVAEVHSVEEDSALASRIWTGRTMGLTKPFVCVVKLRSVKGINWNIADTVVRCGRKATYKPGWPTAFVGKEERRAVLQECLEVLRGSEASARATARDVAAKGKEGEETNPPISAGGSLETLSEAVPRSTHPRVHPPAAAVVTNRPSFTTPAKQPSSPPTATACSKATAQQRSGAVDESGGSAAERKAPSTARPAGASSGLQATTSAHEAREHFFNSEPTFLNNEAEGRPLSAELESCRLVLVAAGKPGVNEGTLSQPRPFWGFKEVVHSSLRIEPGDVLLFCFAGRGVFEYCAEVERVVHDPELARRSWCGGAAAVTASPQASAAAEGWAVITYLGQMRGCLEFSLDKRKLLTHLGYSPDLPMQTSLRWPKAALSKPDAMPAALLRDVQDLVKWCKRRPVECPAQSSLPKLVRVCHVTHSNPQNKRKRAEVADAIPQRAALADRMESSEGALLSSEGFDAQCDPHAVGSRCRMQGNAAEHPAAGSRCRMQGNAAEHPAAGSVPSWPSPSPLLARTCNLPNQTLREDSSEGVPARRAQRRRFRISESAKGGSQGGPDGRVGDLDILRACDAARRHGGRHGDGARPSDTACPSDVQTWARPGKSTSGHLDPAPGPVALQCAPEVVDLTSDIDDDDEDPHNDPQDSTQDDNARMSPPQEARAALNQLGTTSAGGRMQLDTSGARLETQLREARVGERTQSEVAVGAGGASGDEAGEAGGGGDGGGGDIACRTTGDHCLFNGAAISLGDRAWVQLPNGVEGYLCGRCRHRDGQVAVARWKYLFANPDKAHKCVADQPFDMEGFEAPSRRRKGFPQPPTVPAGKRVEADAAAHLVDREAEMMRALVGNLEDVADPREEQGTPEGPVIDLLPGARYLSEHDMSAAQRHRLKHRTDEVEVTAAARSVIAAHLPRMHEADTRFLCDDAAGSGLAQQFPREASMRDFVRGAVAGQGDGDVEIGLIRDTEDPCWNCFGLFAARSLGPWELRLGYFGVLKTVKELNREADEDLLNEMKYMYALDLKCSAKWGGSESQLAVDSVWGAGRSGYINDYRMDLLSDAGPCSPEHQRDPNVVFMEAVVDNLPRCFVTNPVAIPSGSQILADYNGQNGTFVEEIRAAVIRKSCIDKALRAMRSRGRAEIKKEHDLSR